MLNIFILFKFYIQSYLNENSIKRLDSLMFPRTLGNLNTLSLAQNQIEDIQKQSFPFPRLQFL